MTGLRERLKSTLQHREIAFASSKPLSVQVFAQIYGLCPENIINIDPEYVGPQRQEEPTDGALTAVLFKLLQLQKHFSRYDQLQVRVNRGHRVRRLILASDVEFAAAKEGETFTPSHKFVRDNRAADQLSPQHDDDYRHQLWTRYHQPFRAVWSQASGALLQTQLLRPRGAEVHKQQLRVGQIHIGTHFTRGLDAELIADKTNWLPKTNTGVDLARIAQRRRQSFSLWDGSQALFEGPLVSEPAAETVLQTTAYGFIDQLIVAKVLPPSLLMPLLFEPAAYGYVDPRFSQAQSNYVTFPLQRGRDIKLAPSGKV